MTKPLKTGAKRGFVNVNGNNKGQVHMENQGPQKYSFTIATVIPDGNGGFMPCPELLTEAELIRLLRVPEISKAADYHNVITHLKRFHDLPCIHMCRQPLYPLAAVTEWVRKKAEKERIK